MHTIDGERNRHPRPQALAPNAPDADLRWREHGGDPSGLKRAGGATEQPGALNRELRLRLASLEHIHYRDLTAVAPRLNDSDTVHPMRGASVGMAAEDRFDPGRI